MDLGAGLLPRKGQGGWGGGANARGVKSIQGDASSGSALEVRQLLVHTFASFALLSL